MMRHFENTVAVYFPAENSLWLEESLDVTRGTATDSVDTRSQAKLVDLFSSDYHVHC